MKHAIGPAWILALLCAALAVPALAAGPVYWDWPEQVSFDKLELDGVAFDLSGRLMPGLARSEGAAGEADIVWDLAAATDGSIYAATGSRGEVWRLQRDGTVTVAAALTEPELFAVVAAGGAVYAGGGPDGLLLRLGADGGAAETWADLPESYVWDAVADPDGRLYLAAGSPAAVYVVEGRDRARKLATLPATNALCLLRTETGDLLVGTAEPGLVCRLAPRTGAVEVLQEAEDAEIRHLTAGPDGAWYALATVADEAKANGTKGGSAAMSAAGDGDDATETAATVYRIEPGGPVTEFWSGERKLAAFGSDPERGWLGVAAADEDSGGVLLALDPPRGARRLAAWPAGEPVSLLVRPAAAGPLVVGLAHPARLLRLRDLGTEPGTATSEPLDAGMAIRWGRLRWQGEKPAGSEVRWRVRGGPRSVPDDTWTAWSEPWSETDHALELPPVRFLQWQVELSGREPGPRVDAVSVSGRQPNRAPLIESFELQPEGGLDLGGLMSRPENVTETLPGGLQLEYSVTSSANRRAGPLAAARVRPVRTFTWKGSDPNGDRLTYRLEYRPAGGKTWRPVDDWTGEQVGSWNTEAVPDGLYVVRLVASDRPDNPLADALQSTRLLPAVVVDHTPPRIEDFQLTPDAVGFRIRFRAADQTSPIAGVRVELPDGSGERLDPIDGIADSRTEEYDRVVSFPAEGERPPVSPWLVRVIVSDRPGNAAVAEGEVAAADAGKAAPRPSRRDR